MIAVLLAAASSLGYGISDFAGGLAARRAPVLRVVAVTSLASLAVQVSLLPAIGGRWSAAAAGWGAASGLASAAALALFYRSMAAGPMSVLSPVTAVVIAAVPAAAGLAEGERVTAAAAGGLVLALAAVIAVSAGPDDGNGGAGPRPARAALALAVAAGAAAGVVLIFLSATPRDSGVIPLIASRAVTATVVVPIALLRARGGGTRGDWRRGDWRRGGRRLGGAAGLPGVAGLRLAVLAGLFDATANLAFLLAVRHGALVIVAVISALYPAGTILLARRVLGERLTRLQLAGLATAAAAGAILAVA